MQLTKAQRKAAAKQPAAPQLVIGASLAQALANQLPATQPTVPGALASSTLVVPPAQPTAVALPVAVANATVHPTQVVVGLGKPYNVRAGTAFNNVRSWQATLAYLQANGGSCTVGQLAAHLQQLHNHANFAGYCVRRGYLAPVQATVAPTA